MSSADKLTIETPEQTSLEFRLAGIGSRFLALAMDTVIQVSTALLVLVALEIMYPLARLLGSVSQWMLAAGVVGGFLLYEGYFAFFEAVWNGQTPGKRFARLRVIKDDGRPIGVYDALARNLLRIVDQFPGIYAIGVVVMLLGK
ncbi:MAG: RDD family protein, partial [Acidobacteriota bacterium]|nr:RDD family protein [Acidobacteriota bacterium]